MERNLSIRVDKLLNQFPIVAIIGARQVGKTTLVKKLKPDWRYVDMQKPSEQERILADPEIFFRDYPDSVILDEAQIYPVLFDVLRGVIDEDRQKKGRFIITGSSSPELLKHLSESLAGRIAIVELGTLKVNEIGNLTLSNFYQWFENNLLSLNPHSLKITTPPIAKELVDNAWFNGGYPEVHLLDDTEAKQNWFEFYEKSYLYRDVASLFPNINKNNFQRFFRVLGHLSGTILNKAQCARDLEIGESSVKNYLDICAGTFLWRNINSFEKANYKSLVKMPKGHFTDSGLLHYLTGMQNIDFLKQHPLMGRSFESFVIEEIIKGLQVQAIGSWSAYHYRTRNGAEIDLILEGRFGIVPIEIKYGVRIDKRQLISLSKFIEDNGLNLGIIINQASSIEWLTPKIIQIPVGYI
jgi:predicted AAA+ superfamily ATPase